MCATGVFVDMVIKETSLFTKQVQKLLDRESYRLLQLRLVAEPDAGNLIRGTGGVPMDDELFNELVASVREGGAILREEEDAARTFVVEEPDVATIREEYGLSQVKFSALLGISVRTLQNREQGRRKPQGPAKVLLGVASKHPKAVLDVVRKVS